MNNIEFSAEFDVLYNNVTSNQAPGLNEYEKSVFLTKAQAQLINEYFNNRTDGVGGGFDGSQKRQYDFSQLIVSTTLSPATVTTKVDKRSVAYEFPIDYFLSVNEVLSDANYQYSVIPISYAEYSRLMLKPYNFPVKRAVWRIFTGSTTKTVSSKEYNIAIAEIIGKPTMTNGAGMTSAQLTSANVQYTLRYVKKPKPIILEDLTNYGTDLTIDGDTDVSQCQLPEATHQEILERAVALAKIAWAGGTATQATAQQNRES